MREIQPLKIRMEMLLASMDLWDIVHKSKELPSSNADPKVLKEYQRHIKNACSSLTLTWRTTNLRILSVTKDPRKRR